MQKSPIGPNSGLKVILLLTFLIPINVFAEPPFYIALKPGVYSAQSSELEGADPGFNGEIAFGYYFNPNVAAEFGTGYFNTGNFDINVFPLTLTLKAIIPYKRWEFFGLGGGGVYFVTGPFESDSEALMGGYLGGGLLYNITPGVFLGVEGKYLWTEKAMNGIIATAVIGIRF